MRLLSVCIKLQSFLKENRFFSILFFIWLTLPLNAWAYSAYSTPELDELEKKFIQEINQSNQVLRDPKAIQYINHIGTTLAKTANMPPPYFFIVKANEINAFAGPGGYIGINSALILATKNESELAAVMAHELAHVRLHHLYNMVVHEQQKRIPMLAAILASVALGAINPTLGSGALMASLTGFAQDSINFTRSKEKEADRIGMDMLKKAGFNPKGMVNFFKKMQENSRYYYTKNIPAILRTHPMDEERIAEAENRLLHFELTKESSVDYKLFKELIRTTTSTDRKALLDFYKIECIKQSSIEACLYGETLTLLQVNNYQKAMNNLNILLDIDENNLYYTFAMVDAEIGMGNYDNALKRMKEVFALNPKNYAVILHLSQSLLAANKNEEAVFLLYKGRRIYKRDLVMCKQLALAQSSAKQRGYAYFTQAECELLEGHNKKALQQLKIAENLTKKDSIMQERIKAKKEEIAEINS